LEFENFNLEEKLSNKFKKGLPCKSLNFMYLGYPSKKSQNHGNSYARKIFMTIFEFIEQLFFSNFVFKLQEDIFQSSGSEYSLKTNMEVSRHFLFYRFETKRVLKRFQKKF
jgi:hypothetical protein